MDYSKRLLFLLIIIILVCSISKAGAPRQSENFTDLVIIQNNSLMAVSQPGYFSLEEIEKAEAVDALLSEITHRESTGDEGICNLDYGCGAGAGLCGFIPMTWNSTLERMKEDNIYMPTYCWQEVSLPIPKSHPIFNSECHLIICEWLLRADGIVHWEEYSGPYPEELINKL